jgi:hypothetical protein
LTLVHNFFFCSPLTWCMFSWWAVILAFWVLSIGMNNCLTKPFTKKGMIFMFQVSTFCPV